MKGFDNYVTKLEKALNRFLPRASEEPKIIHKAMRYSVFSEAKRIRPIIVLESCRTCGGNTGDAIPAASAIELVHTYSLIHDDLPSMDDDDYRRGKPSCHKAFGEANAILAGDALLTLAFNILAEKYAPAMGAKMIRVLSSAIGSEGMIGGQALDMKFCGKYKDNKVKKIINRLKTAKLFKASASLGAISSGRAAARTAGAISKYGIFLGMAFQIVDDILDRENNFSHADAEILIKKAKDALNVFGKRADNLKKIADYVLRRG